MTDQKNQDNQGGRGAVLTNMTYVLSYLGANMGVNREMIVGMIAEVENNWETVGEYLRNIKTRRKHQGGV